MSTKFEIVTPINKTLGQFIKNCPYRDPNKIKQLVKQKYDVDISTKLIHEYVPQLDKFDQNKAKNKYQMRTVGNLYSYMGDIMFPVGNKVAFLLLIEINTRKAFGYQLGDIKEHEIINVDTENYERIIFAPKSKLKTTVSLIKAFNKFLNEVETPVKYLKFDGESGVNNNKFQTYLIQNGIEFIPVLKNAHTSLSLINRLCRTIRDIAYNMNVNIVNQSIMNEVLELYNNAPHKTITNICFKNDSNLKKLYPNGISPNDVYYSYDEDGIRYLERLIIRDNVRHNILVGEEINDLNIRDKCRIYEDSDKFTKKRSKLSKDIYQIVGLKGNIYQVQNINSGEIKNVQRSYISKV